MTWGTPPAILLLDAAAAAKGYLLTPARFGARNGLNQSCLLSNSAGAATGILDSAATKRWRNASGLQPLELARDSRRSPAISANVGSGFSTGRIKSKLNGMTNPRRS